MEIYKYAYAWQKFDGLEFITVKLAPYAVGFRLKIRKTFN